MAMGGNPEKERNKWWKRKSSQFRELKTDGKLQKRTLTRWWNEKCVMGMLAVIFWMN